MDKSNEAVFFIVIFDWLGLILIGRREDGISRGDTVLLIFFFV